MNLKEAQKLCIDGKRITCDSFIEKGNYVVFIGGSFMFKYKGKTPSHIGSTFNNADKFDWRVFCGKRIKIAYDILDHNGCDVKTGFDTRVKAEREIILLPLGTYSVCKSYHVMEE